MEAIARLGLSDKGCQVSLPELKAIFDEFGAMELLSDTLANFDWKPVLRPATQNDAKRRESKSQLSVLLETNQIAWYFDEGTFEGSHDYLRMLSTLLRAIAICERCVEEGLISWWVMGLNRNSGIPTPEDIQGLDRVAAYRIGNIVIPGFVNFRGVMIALHAVLQLKLVSQPPAPSVEDISTAEAINHFLQRRFKGIDDLRN